MRPRLLELTAFGPYPGVVRVDFDALSEAGLWVLPNPSGLNASYQLPELVRTYSELRAAAFDDAQG